MFTDISLTEEMILNEEFLPPYMKGWRRFRIEYLEPDTGFSNCEGVVYLPPDAEYHDTLNTADALEAVLRQSLQDWCKSK